MARKQGDPECVHTVEADDTLYDIANVYWGDGDLWTWITEVNHDVTPENLQVGQQLRIIVLSMGQRLARSYP